MQLFLEKVEFNEKKKENSIFLPLKAELINKSI